MKRVAHAMGLGHDEYAAFREAVRQLMREGRVVRGGDDRIMLPDATDVIVGRFRGHARGFGFVVPDSPTDHGDLFIPPPATLNAITGDTVAARITRRGRRSDDQNRVEGEIIEIIERGQSRFVGELVRQNQKWYMVPDGNALLAPVQLGDVSATRAQAGDQVVVELTEFPSNQRPATGVIVSVLGHRGDPGVDTVSIIHQYNFAPEFPQAVLDDARRAVHDHNLNEELARREDLRNEVVITIDPDDARDFDDAISIRKLPHGRLELGVHIADVSAFVQPDSPLDREAQRRGNSIYFPGQVIPMLPEVLSNGLCSLQEGEPRLAKSVFIEYDRHGHRLSKRYANSVIQSAKRLTYAQATRILEGNQQDFPVAVVNLLGDMDRLARAIRKRRLAAGMLVLDLTGIDLILNDSNEVIGVRPEDTSFSHTIIEMFMVEANEAVAELFSSLRVPHLRRIHPEPPGDVRKKLSGLLRVLGKTVPPEIDRRDMIRLIESVRDKPESFIVNLAVLRSMAQAEYSPKHVGHFALASRHYAHFTSPIRRYPDLVIHRLLDLYLQGQLSGRDGRRQAPSAEALATLGKHCSYTERRAEAAERELRLVKLLRFLQGKQGDFEDGIVTDVTNLGLFVQLRAYQVEGLVRFDDLPGDWWNINPQSGSVVGQRSGIRIAIGDPVKVQIAGVDLAARKLDLALPPDALQAQRSRPRGKRSEQPEKPIRGAVRNHTVERESRGRRGRTPRGRGRPPRGKRR